MTSAEAKGLYEHWLQETSDAKRYLKEARTKATEFSNLYGRLCREELRAASQNGDSKPSGDKP